MLIHEVVFPSYVFCFMKPMNYLSITLLSTVGAPMHHFKGQEHFNSGFALRNPQQIKHILNIPISPDSPRFLDFSLRKYAIDAAESIARAPNTMVQASPLEHPENLQSKSEVLQKMGGC